MRASERRRAAQTGRDRCARPPRGGRPSRHLSHSLPARSPPIPSEIQRQGDGRRSARCGERRRSSAPAAPPLLTPAGLPARPCPPGPGREGRRDLPRPQLPSRAHHLDRPAGRPGVPGIHQRTLLPRAGSARFRSLPAFQAPGTRPRAPLGGFRAAVLPEPGAFHHQTQTPRPKPGEMNHHRGFV